MTDSTNLWTGLLNDELYERTNEVEVFLTKMAADLGEATDGAVRAAYHKQSEKKNHYWNNKVRYEDKRITRKKTGTD